MDEDLYDEFGNYLGSGLESEESSEGSDNEQQDEVMEEEKEDVEVMDDKSTAIVLHEDKKYYPDASEVYPEGVQTLVEDEDRTTLETPTVAKIKAMKFHLVEPNVPTTTFDKAFLESLMQNSALARNVCLVGHLHHGKTSLVDLFVEETHRWPDKRRINRYADSRRDEQDRKVSLKMHPMSFVLQNSDAKSFGMNIIDTPGHPCFWDEVTAGMQLADGCVLVVDALEGVMLQTNLLIRHAIQHGLPIVLVINKVDRLILEARVPPTDAYFILRHIIEDVNDSIRFYSYFSATSSVRPSTYDTRKATQTGSKQLKDQTPEDDSPAMKHELWPRLSPEQGNVMFSSAKFGFCFTLDSFARLYGKRTGVRFPVQSFASRLWGDLYAVRNDENQSFKFTSRGPTADSTRTFVQFILEPLYKICAVVIGEDPPECRSVLSELGVHLRPAQYKLDGAELMRLVLKAFFGGCAPFVDVCVKHIPSPGQAARRKVEFGYRGDLSSDVARSMMDCDRNGPLVVHVTKQFDRQDCETFDVLGRVYSGVLKVKRIVDTDGNVKKVVGQKVRVLGERYTPADEEDMLVRTVSNMWLMQGRYRIEISEAHPGMIVLLEGVEESIVQSATLSALHPPSEMSAFRPMLFDTIAWMKVAIEPINPAELPRLMDAVKKCQRSYTLLGARVEESGEHVLLGTGELYLDCVLHDIRRMYSEIEVKVADPITVFNETVTETSSMKCYADTVNKRNRITVVAEPLEPGLAEDIESGAFSLDWDPVRISNFLVNKYGWDLLASRSVWDCGPASAGPNLLVDDTLPTEVNKDLLSAIKKPIVQGFQWAVREGALCAEQVRNVRFRLIGGTVAEDPPLRQSAQIVPTMRRVAFSSFLMAMPRLMEPILYVEVLCPSDCVTGVYNVLSKRRGHVTQDLARPGSPLYVVKAFLPAIDSFGFETDLRVHTQGQAMPLSVFDHWDLVPGDPLDKSIAFQPLEKTTGMQIAREFMVKTRRRKDLGDDVAISKYFDDPLLLEMARDDARAMLVE